ncbi:MAG: DEAD/DEAH box helicase family protein [Alphaproteobacteria bacterium]
MAKHLNILKESVRRGLHSGMLTSVLPLNTPQFEGLEGYSTFLNEAPEEDAGRAYADMATGTGKTGFFSVVTRHAHQTARERGLGNNFRTVIVEPTLPLLTQTHGMLVQAAPELAGAVGFYGGGQKDLSKPVSIITYDAWLELLESGQLSSENVSLHINDEAHFSLSQRRRSLLDERLSDVLHFGVTASSEYDATKTLELTHKKRVYKLDLPEAIERGFLTDYAHVQYYVMRILPDMLKEEGASLSNGEFTLIKRLEWAKLVTRAYATLVDGISGQPLSDKVGIAFAADTRHADGLAARLNSDQTLQRKAKELGFKNVAVSIHSVGYSDKIQDALLEQFMNGDFMIAVGDKKFQVGFDYSRIKFVASYPGNSPVDTIQEIGRATRRYIDPRTGMPQGTVIMEAIPYIGDVDPEKDARARRDALAKVITAYRILKRTLVLAPGRELALSNIRPVAGAERKSILLSPQCEVETYITEEDTLTISRQMDEAYGQRRFIIDKEDLTEEKLVSWIKATLEKTGKIPTFNDREVYGYQADGSIEIIPNETWNAIHQSLERGARGSVKEDGTLFADGLFDFKKKHGFASDKEDLSEEKIVSWIRATLEKTGRLPIQTDMIVYGYQAGGSIEIVQGETWKAIDACIANGRRGLVKEDSSLIATSLSDLKKKYGFGKSLTEEQIVSWIKATLEKTGRIPTSNDKTVYGYQADGSIEDVSGETWIGIHKFLQKGLRGLPKTDGLLTVKGLSDLKKKHGFAIDKGDLTEEQIVSWIKATLEKTGRFPVTGGKDVYGYQADGSIEVVSGETWLGINQSLKNGHRGLTKKDGSLIAVGLYELKQKHGFTREKSSIQSTSGNSESLPSNQIDPTEIARQAIVGLFADLKGDLVAQITEAVVAKLQGQVSSVGGEQSIAVPKTRRSRKAIASAGIADTTASPVHLFRFATFDSPLFLVRDAVGDSMLSCLTNAERAFSANDFVGMKGNLRKFVEMCIHSSMLLINENYLRQLGVDRGAQRSIGAVTSSYLQSLGNSGFESKTDKAETDDRIATFRKVIAILRDHNAEQFPAQLLFHARQIASAAGDVHFQMQAMHEIEPEELLGNGLGLAQWFNDRFCADIKKQPEVEAISGVGPSSASADMEVPSSIIPSSVLKTLGVTSEQVDALKDTHAYQMVMSFSVEWAAEPTATKQNRNALIQRLYADIAPLVGSMINEGKAIQEIADQLNNTGISRHPRSGNPVEWTANLLLRGAVLTMNALPWNAFAADRRELQQLAPDKKLGL